MMKILTDNIGHGFPPYIIAELSANHGGSIERAKKSIRVAKDAGASAVKIQSYTPDTMTIDCKKEDFLITEGLWRGRNLYDLYAEASTPFDWHKELFAFAKQCGITLFSTPFDESAVDLLEELDTPAYKIASFELTDLPLIEYVARKQKPMFISTGMASLEEITEAVNIVKNSGNNQLLLFHCVSAYPAETKDSQLNNLKLLKREFNIPVGLSDHSISNTASIMSLALGGVAIEKHFKLDSDDCGPDTSFSLLPSELQSLVDECKSAWEALGQEGFLRSETEQKNLKFRRSLYFIKDLKAGETLNANNVRKIRPGFGLLPKFYAEVMGQKLTKDVKRGEPVKWDCVTNCQS